MSYTLDPELAPAMAALAGHAAEAARPARGDWQAVRAAASAGLAYMASITPASSGVVTTSFAAAASGRCAPSVRVMSVMAEAEAGAGTRFSYV
jgi:hypothetical protein